MCVRVIGLEPTRLTAPDPKSGAAANYADMEQIEWGIEPDIKINMDEADETKHIDTIIEKARAFLKGEWTPAVSE